jgi:histidyl-tRNA synthetase
MYSGKDVPAVGVSIGVERVFTVLEAKLRAQAEAAKRSIRETKTQVLVGSFGKGLQVHSAHPIACATV